MVRRNDDNILSGANRPQRIPLRLAALLCVFTAVTGCSAEKRDVGPSTPSSPPTGPHDPRQSLYQTNHYQQSEGGRLFRWAGCDGCHTDGARGPANLSDDRWSHGGSVAEIYQTTASGAPGMPAYASRLTSEELWQVAGYVKSLLKTKPDMRVRNSAGQQGEPSRGDLEGGVEMKRAVPAALALAAVVALAGCDGIQSVLHPLSDEAGALHGLMGVMLAVCGVAYLLVMVFLAAAIWRARRPLTTASARGEVGLTRGLVGWVGLMLIGLCVMTGASFLVERTLAKEDARPPDVRITGHQWWWRVQYWDAPSRQWIETANELHLPLDASTRVEVVSSDVIHSFWIPNLSGKLDMIPGRVNRLTLTPRQAGWLRGQCAEFCGLQHSEMALDVKVEPRADFDAWRGAQAAAAAAPTDQAALHGRDVFTNTPCSTCHTVRGQSERGRAGPDLTHVGSRRFIGAGTLPMSHAGLMGWIAQPQDHKPGVEMPATGLAPADIDAVARYLEGLK